MYLHIIISTVSTCIALYPISIVSTTCYCIYGSHTHMRDTQQTDLSMRPSRNCPDENILLIASQFSLMNSQARSIPKRFPIPYQNERGGLRGWQAGGRVKRQRGRLCQLL